MPRSGSPDVTILVERKYGDLEWSGSGLRGTFFTVLSLSRHSLPSSRFFSRHPPQDGKINPVKSDFERVIAVLAEWNRFQSANQGRIRVKSSVTAYFLQLSLFNTPNQTKFHTHW
jgi:hypothetical protein